MMDMKNVFRFKQFAVQQDLCGMKVGTDGVLLGAWAQGGRQVLDVGTGTGLIALMMAQRFNRAQILAIDLESGACQQARINVDASAFRHQVQVEEVSVQHLSQRREMQGTFDAVVSNPPFFVRSLKSQSAARMLARHTDTLSYADLFRSVSLLLTARGEFSAVIPTDSLDDFLSESCIHGLFLHRRCLVKTTEGKMPKRCLVAFGKEPATAVEESEGCLLAADGEKTEWYRSLTNDFYLK